MSLEIGETPLSVAEEPLLPVRMLNEFAYCPRLAYLEWVQSEFADSADTVEGRFHHRRVDAAPKRAAGVSNHRMARGLGMPRNADPAMEDLGDRRHHAEHAAIPRLKCRGPIEVGKHFSTNGEGCGARSANAPYRWPRSCSRRGALGW